MADQEDPKITDKSTPDLQVLPGGVPLKATNPERKKENKYRGIHAAIVDAMTGKFSRYPEFPTKLHRWVDHMGQSVSYEEHDGIVRMVSPDHIHSLIADYWALANRLLPQTMYLGPMAAEDGLKIRKLWTMASPARTEPFPLVTWKSDPRPCHHKLDFDPIPADQLKGSAPLFAELMSRTTNSHALMAFIGSLFDEKSQRQQYCWIFGEGKNGKGALVRCLAKLLGPVYGSEEAPTGDSKHWTCGLLGKRLVVFADCNNASFVTTGRFKSLTGEDKIRVEIKGGAILSLDIFAKYLFTSNAKPKISSTTADIRRILYSYVKPVDDAKMVDNYEENLWGEMPNFISACWHQYQICTNGNPRAEIPVKNADEVSDIAEDSEHEYETFVSEYLRFDHDTVKPAKDRKYTRPGQMLEAMNQAGFKDPYSRRCLRDYLERKHHLVCRSHRVTTDEGVEAIKVWLGVMILKRQ